MTIKELENKTGMTRANIRFYEGEGLLSPKRLDNGYRDYSEEDARTLEKIKLLRQLQLDLDTIRTLQKGTLSLEQALFAQLTRLEGDRAVIERAAQVCRELERSGVEYGALDPQPWLEQLRPPEQGQLAPAPKPPAPKEEDDAPRACWHPWMRWLARGLDIALYDVVFSGLWLVVFHDQTIVRAGGVFGWLLTLLSLVFALAVEPLWLHYWGWTPGKWIFGLKLRDEDGNKLTLKQGAERSAALLWQGYGFNIPIYNLWRMWKCRKLGLEGRDCPWDGEEGYRYTKEERRFSALMFVAVQGARVGLLVLAVLFSNLPICRGSLTVEEYAQNYNHFYDMLLASEETTLPKLYENGGWKDHSVHQGAAIIDLTAGTEWDDPEYVLDHDRVTSVTIRMESTSDIFYNTGSRELLALLAMTGGADGLNLFNYDLKGWGKVAGETFAQWEDADFTYRGLHITQQVEAEGYDVTGSMLWSREGESHRCEKTVTISLVN